MQYLVCCLALSISKPFRKPIYTNYLFAGSAIVMGTYQTVQIVVDMEWNQWLFDLTTLPKSFRYEILGLVVVNSIMSYGFEKLVNYVSNRQQQR